MSKKRPLTRDGIVFSTDPSFKPVGAEETPQETLAPNAQKLRIRLDTKHRAGKAVTLVEGFSGTEDDLEELGKKIKSFCGTGGSVKDGFIIIQGDQRDKILQWCIKNGFKLSKKV
jgi:translation initiation factor 1